MAAHLGDGGGEGVGGALLHDVCRAPPLGAVLVNDEVSDPADVQRGAVRGELSTGVVEQTGGVLGGEEVVGLLHDGGGSADGDWKAVGSQFNIERQKVANPKIP